MTITGIGTTPIARIARLVIELAVRSVRLTPKITIQRLKTGPEMATPNVSIPTARPASA
jgi:hypothetical protein